MKIRKIGWCVLAGIIVIYAIGLVAHMIWG
jgi:hypothetical protein